MNDKRKHVSWNAYKKNTTCIKVFTIYRTQYSVPTCRNVGYIHSSCTRNSQIWKSTLMIPHGKYRFMLVACPALFSARGLSWDKFPFSGDGSTDMHASQQNRLSCRTNVPYKKRKEKKKKIYFLKFTQKHIMYNHLKHLNLLYDWSSSCLFAS